MNFFPSSLSAVGIAAISTTVLAGSSAEAVTRKTPVTPVSTAPANIVQVQAPEVQSPAPLAGLNFLILALDDIDPTQIIRRPTPTIGPSLPLVPADGETVRSTPPSVPVASIVPRKAPVAPPKSLPDVQPDREPDAFPPPSIRPLGWGQELGYKGTFWRASAQQGFQLVQSTPDRILPGPEPRSPETNITPIVPFGDKPPAAASPFPDANKPDATNLLMKALAR